MLGRRVRVELLTAEGTPMGSALAELWQIRDEFGLIGWGGILRPVDGTAHLDADTSRLVLTMPSGRRGHAIAQQSHLGFGKRPEKSWIKIGGTGPAPFGP